MIGLWLQYSHYKFSDKFIGLLLMFSAVINITLVTLACKLDINFICSNEYNILDSKTTLYLISFMLPSPIFTLYLISTLTSNKLHDIYKNTNICAFMHIVMGILFILAGLLSFYGLWYYHTYIHNHRESIINMTISILSLGIICVSTGILLFTRITEC